MKEPCIPLHFVSKHCKGEFCSICGEPATHKVGEEMMSDDPTAYDDIMGFGPCPLRHNYTAYVCCNHFREIFGSAVPCEAPQMDVN